jgi:ATP-dependent Clp protease ATP-binding subunit ClpA
VTLQLTDAGRAWLARNDHDRAFGARPMGRLIHSKIKEPLVDEILFGRLSAGGNVVVDADGKDLRLVY